jgi:hypothetical protein
MDKISVKHCPADILTFPYIFATGLPGMIAPPTICTRFSMLGAYPTVQFNYYAQHIQYLDDKRGKDSTHSAHDRDKQEGEK